MTAPGWFPDPTGRFSERWHDGTDWTDQVLGANGQATGDPLARTSSGFSAPTGPSASAAPPPAAPMAAAAPPPAMAGPWAPAPPAAGGWAPPGPAWAPGAAPADDRPRSAGIGVLLSFLGLVPVLLSLFALDWADGGATFSKLRDAYADAPSGLPAADAMVKGYAQFGAYLLLAMVALGLVLVATGALGHGRGFPRAVVAVVAAVAAVVHLAVVLRLFRGPASPEAGAWIAVVGYLAAIVGLGFGPKRRRAG